MAELTANDLTELAELLKRDPSAANIGRARRALKPPRQTKPRAPKPTEREKLLARIDKAMKLNETLLALRVEHCALQNRQPGDLAAIRRQAMIHADIAIAYVDVNETLRDLLPKVREVLAFSPDPEKTHD